MKSNRMFRIIMVFVRHYFSLDKDRINESDVIESIKRGVEFKGTNLWVLIFAIFIASIGLNVNSTAVIIGAMLISPLMGPIMGIGLGVGTYDFELIKKAVRNLIIAVAASVLTSTIYFFFSPLSQAQSELLARTTPTIWDVFIALFGGLAGIIAGSSKEKGNVIPGVAIATALMPPLCTAGYGIANGNFGYFIGAMYLFFINSIFIGLATIIIVRFLKFRVIEFVNVQVEKRIKRYIYIIVFLTVVPSLYLGYRIVNRSIFEQNAMLFLKNEFNFPQTQIINKNITSENGKKEIDILTIGKSLSTDLITSLKNKLPNYNLKNANLIIRQAEDNPQSDINTIKTSIIEDLYKNNVQLIKSKDDKIAFLENKIGQLKQEELPVKDITRELLAEHTNIKEFAVNRSIMYNVKDTTYDTLVVAYLNFNNIPSKEEIKRLKKWLMVRTKSQKIKLIIQ